MPIQFSRSARVRSAPFALFMAALALRSAVPSETAWGFDPNWLWCVGVVLAGALLWRWRGEYGELFAQTRPAPGEALLAVLVGAAVFGLVITLDAPWMRVGEATSGFRPVDAAGNIVWPLVAARCVGAVLVVALLEELFWRSFLMRWIEAPQFDAVDPSRVGLRAVVLSTFVFVLVQPLWLSALLAGFAYAWLYKRNGRLWSAVIAHGVANALLGVWVVFSGNWGFW